MTIPLPLLKKMKAELTGGWDLSASVIPSALNASRSFRCGTVTGRPRLGIKDFLGPVSVMTYACVSHNTHMEARGQLVGIVLCLYHVGPGDGIQVFGLGGK